MMFALLLLKASCQKVSEGYFLHLALRKSNNDVRPIAIGESLRRLTARAICLQMKDTFADFFSPVQHGVSTECGTELLSHHVQLLLEANPDWVVLKTDVKNAINSLDRCQLLKEVSLLFHDLFCHVQQMYLNINSLVFLQKENPVILTSQQGVHQEDPLGPALFSTAIHPFLMDTQKANPGILVLAYLDDVFLLGPSSEFSLHWKTSEQLS